MQLWMVSSPNRTARGRSSHRDSKPFSADLDAQRADFSPVMFAPGLFMLSDNPIKPITTV